MSTQMKNGRARIQTQVRLVTKYDFIKIKFIEFLIYNYHIKGSMP